MRSLYGFADVTSQGSSVSTDLNADLHGCLSDCDRYSDNPQYYKICIDGCNQAFPSPAVPTTPGDLTNQGLNPPAGFQPTALATNWWRIGALAVIGLGTLIGLTLIVRGGRHHAA